MKTLRQTKLEIQYKPVDQIKPYPNNARRHSREQIDSIKQSVEVLGNRKPIEIDENGVIICGHGRFEAYKALEMKSIPVIIHTDMTEDEKKAYRIADNETALQSEWDDEILKLELSTIDIDLESLKELKMEHQDQTEAAEDDYEVPDEIKTDIKLGDIITIGRHRLMCGDSTDAEQVAKLMNGNKVDMVFTDPPYGISIVGGGKPFGTIGGGKIVKAKNYRDIIGDNTTDTAKKFIKLCFDLQIENLIIFGGNYFTDILKPSMCWLVWDKQNTGNFADCELAWTSYNKAAKLYKWQWNGMIRKGDKEIEGKSRCHPTQKPVGLFIEIFKDFEFNICFDGFLGSGSTMVACEQTNRICYGMEIDPQYCQVIIDRMKKLNPSIEVNIS